MTILSQNAANYRFACYMRVCHTHNFSHPSLTLYVQKLEMGAKERMNVQYLYVPGPGGTSPRAFRDPMASPWFQNLFECKFV